ncbi:kynureninase [Okeania sp. SIO2C2]|uniref:kynureninase n=1 Tax=Okeania sp. SIO2C2 TaxID=2607787 RepID=UPI00257D14EC|nr:kynureninase [Okeania sp. SIO2C2]
MIEYRLEQEFAEQMDARDPLASLRKEFYIPKAASGEENIYFCGHSLGLQPVTVRESIEKVLYDWEKLGIEGYFCGTPRWLDYSKSLKPKMAEIVGALESEIAIMNTLTMNLHLMLVSFYRPSPEKYKILIEANAFPSPRYALKSQIEFHGYDPEIALLEIKPRQGETYIRTEDIENLLEQEGNSIALVFLGGINYLTGQFFEMKKITEQAHQYGCLVGFDLAHAVGNVTLALHDWQVDFAVWCNYKYMNSGPGAVGACFVHEKYAHQFNLPRFAGWWGNKIETRLQMKRDFEPSSGAEGWQISNSDVLSLASLSVSLDIFARVGMAQLVTKSRLLTGYLEFLLNSLENKPLLLTPANPEARGCQLSIQIKNAEGNLLEKLTERGILCDWREPNTLRIAPVPLYNRYAEVFQFVQALSEL